MKKAWRKIVRSGASTSAQYSIPEVFRLVVGEWRVRTSSYLVRRHNSNEVTVTVSNRAEPHTLWQHQRLSVHNADARHGGRKERRSVRGPPRSESPQRYSLRLSAFSPGRETKATQQLMSVSPFRFELLDGATRARCGRVSGRC
jgi:hypothetical protein